MLAFFIWLITFPSLICHLLYVFCILALIVSYKFYKFLRRQPQVSSISSAKMMNKAKLMIMRRHFCSHNAHLTLVILTMLVASLACQQAFGLEQDAVMMKPFDTLAREIIDLVTLGKIPEINVSPMDVGRSMGRLAFQTGLRRPTAVPQKTSDLVKRISERVFDGDVGKLPRKSMAELRTDLHSIMDSIMATINDSSDGVFTNYLNVQVGEKSLEDALVALGMQFKAAGTDLLGYRDLAEKLMAIPGLPKISGHMNSVADLTVPTFGTVTDMASNMVRMPVKQVSGAASSSLSWLKDIRKSAVPAAA